MDVVSCEEDEPPVVPDEQFGNKDQQSKYNLYDEVSKLNLQTHKIILQIKLHFSHT